MAHRMGTDSERERIPLALPTLDMYLDMYLPLSLPTL